MYILCGDVRHCFSTTVGGLVLLRIKNGCLTEKSRVRMWLIGGWRIEMCFLCVSQKKVGLGGGCVAGRDDIFHAHMHYGKIRCGRGETIDIVQGFC